jgi:hypothetical protein
MKQEKIDKLTTYYMSEQGMTARKLKNRLKKEEEKEQAERNQKPVKDMTISIEWKKSYMWGNNPNAEVTVIYEDGSYIISSGYKCSGCGYDKESTVIAQIFNQFLKYKLWQRENMDNSNKPYGISLDFNYNPYYSGGVGTNCYYRVAEFIGGKFERITSGKTYDVYKFTMNN